MAKTTNRRVKLDNVRLSFPHLDQPHSVRGGAPRWGANFIMTPDDHRALLRKLEAMIDEVATEGKIRLKGDNTCLRDGDDNTNQDGEIYQGYEGNKYIAANANEKRRPKLYTRRGKQTLDADIFYGGCYVNAWIDIWPQNDSAGKRVNAALVGVQFVEDGESFGGAAPMDDDLVEDLGPGDSDVEDDDMMDVGKEDSKGSWMD